MPTATGPDEVTVRLDRQDFRRHHRDQQRGRRRSALLRRWRTVLAVVMVAAVVGAATWALFFSPYLLAERTSVVDAGDVGEARVARAAEVPVGVPLARVDVDGVRARVEAIPAVARAEVSRSWPHTVRVQVTPRVPVATVAGRRAPEGQVAVLDASGAAFAAPADRAVDLPEVRLASGVDADGIAEAGRVVSSLPADLAGRVARVDVGSVDEISLTLRGGRTISWGSAEQSDLKAQVLGVLLSQVPADVDQLDVSVPGRPTTR